VLKKVKIVFTNKKACKIAGFFDVAR